MTDLRPGDVDGDGQLSRSDLDLLKQVLNDSGYGAAVLDRLSPEEKARLDINQDGRIDHADMVRLCELMLAGDSGSANRVADKFSELRARYSP